MFCYSFVIYFDRVKYFTFTEGTKSSLYHLVRSYESTDAVSELAKCAQSSAQMNNMFKHF